jgi:hypothetical protein
MLASGASIFDNHGSMMDPDAGFGSDSSDRELEVPAWQLRRLTI